ncbi:MAG: hypothetical protein M1576_00375 [Deltaproteobacteria bacterium]|jgi:hypothetical protein|nr:hypothetical protein [Deltaproteobacteria bacterium]
MAVEIYRNTNIYIACPANVATGGPELLHQLGFHFINDLNIKAFMYYYDFDNNKFKSPMHPEYRFYGVPHVLELPEKQDVQENIFIVPEVLSGLQLLFKYKNIRKGIWFLSVDNYYYSKITKKYFFLLRVFNKVGKLLNKKSLFGIAPENNLKYLAVKYDYRKDSLLKLANFYMTNSYRNMYWFKELKPLYYLSEYLNIEFLNIQINISEKENIVIFNPKKGFEFTGKIIDSTQGIKFIPLINMNRIEVINMLKKAKVYIDFGNHPGKDRLPREAAILRCCVITGKRGSAAFYEDIPIPDEYKFEDKKENIPKIICKILECFGNYEKKYKDFDYYREVIKQEPQKFVEDVKKIFVKV